MARPASTYHPLREIRRILGLSQKRFAEAISIAPVTLKKIENGDLKLSDEVASRIFAETEVPLWRLDGQKLSRLGKDTPLTTWDGRPLSREQYEERKRSGALIPLERIDRIVQDLAFHIQVLLDAACASTPPKAQLVFGALQTELNQIKTEFRLDAQVEKVLAEDGGVWAPGHLGQAAGSNHQARAKRYAEREKKLDIKKRGISPSKPRGRVP